MAGKERSRLVLRRARGAGEAGRMVMEPGAVVEVDPETAEECGACAEDCLDLEEALAAAVDPAAGEGRGRARGA